MRTQLWQRLMISATSLWTLAPANIALAAGPNGSDTPPRVAVVAGLDPQQISSGTVELYRQVASRLVERGIWMVAQDQEVRATLATDRRFQGLGSIAAVDRGQIVKSVARKQKRGRVIRSVQAMTDTLALDGAVLVDCRATSKDLLKACAVYYYDRGAGRIVAASTKSFSVPIADATRWAPVLVDQMVSGLAAHRSVKTRERLEAMMVEGDAGERDLKPVLGVEVIGVGLRDPHGDVSSLPTLSVSAGTQGETFSASLYGEYGKASSSQDDAGVTVTERSIGMAFAARSRALEAIYWDLGIAGGLVSRQVERTGYGPAAAAEAGRQEERAFRLKFHPGLLWQFGEHVQVGPSLYWIKDVALDRRSSGSMDGAAVEAAGFGAGMRLRTVF